MPSTSPRKLPRLLLVIPHPLPSATIYIIKPLMELARQNRVRFDVVTESETTLARLRASDIVLFCRNIEPAADWILEECLLRNTPTVYHLDDNLWEVPDGLNYTAYFHAPERIRQLEHFLNRVSLVRVYSQPLVGRALQFNPNVNLVIPCIDMNLVPRFALPRRDNKVRITYATGRGNGDSLITLFSQDLLKLVDTYPTAVEMYWWGEVPAEFLHHPATRLVHIIHDYDQYLNYLSHQGFDIGLAPLTPTSFNLSKTNTKFRDYGACRIPGVYSDVDVYSCCIEHEKTGLLVRDTPGGWFETLQRLLIDVELREQIKRAAYEYVDHNYRQELVELQWLEVIDSLLESQDRSVYPPMRPTEQSTCISLVGESSPPAGFIGVGKQRLPGVQVIADPGCSLPFATDSADILLSDWLLEQNENPECAIRELYRVSRHSAQVSILTGYSTPTGIQQVRRAYWFDEETPRRWTEAEPPVYQIQPGLEEFMSPGSAPAHAASNIDLRCVGMVFFHSPAVLSLPEQEKRRLRRLDPTVCRRVLYRCVVVKRPVTETDLQQWVQTPFIDPPQVIVQRLQDDGEILKDEIVETHAEIRSLQSQLKAKEIEVITRNAELNAQMRLAKLLVQEIDAYRNRKLIRVIERFIDRVDYSTRLPPAYQQIRDDNLNFFQPLKGYRLRPSLNLQRVLHLAYPVQLQHAGLKQITFAGVIDLYPRQGKIGVEVVGNGKVLASASLPAPNIQADEPLVFDFNPLSYKAGDLLEVRLFARDLDVPLRIYEWHHYPFFGLGKPQIKPFCSFDFHS